MVTYDGRVGCTYILVIMLYVCSGYVCIIGFHLHNAGTNFRSIYNRYISVFFV